MNLKRRLATFFLTIFTALMAAPLAANGGTYTAGDLVLFFFQENGSQTIYVNLGPAHTYRANAAGPQDAPKNLNILNIKSALDQAYGTNWATKDNVYAGLAAVRSAGISTTGAAVNGDPNRTIYTSVANDLVSDPGGRIVPGNTDMTTIAGRIISMNTRFPENIDYAVVPSADSFIEGQNPFFASGILDSAFGSLAGGVAQVGTATSLGSFGEVSNVEFALDLHRILATNGGSGTITGGLDSDGNPVPIRTSTYEGTITINSNGIVGFSAIPPAPPAAITVNGTLSALNSVVGNASATTSFTVAGANMREAITITAPEGFEISMSPTSDFSSSITVGAAGTINSTPIYVRLSASANIGTYSGDISLTSGSTIQTIATAESTVSAAVANPVISISGNLTALSTTYGTASSTSNFTISGTNMTAPITVTAPTGFQVSTSPTSGFDTSINVPASGTLANTTIHVRLSPTANAGTYSGNITLTSTGATEKTIATASSTINKATPTITTSPTATAITFGQKLSDSVLSNGAGSVPGTFDFTNRDTTPNAGTASQSVTFTPTNTTNYNTATTSVTVTVNKATPTIITSPTATAITYGQKLSDSTLSNGAGSVPGTFDFTNRGTSPNAGTSSQSVTFTPSNTTNYNTATTSVSVTVNKATPTITTAPTASSIKKGQTLAKSNINGAASVAGQFGFDDPSISPVIGTANQAVTFTPADITNYNTLKLQVSVTVIASSEPIITSSSTANSTYLQGFEYQITATNDPISFGAIDLPQGLSVNSSTGIISGNQTNAGEYNVTITATNETSTYQTSLKISINKATPGITSNPKTSAITYGQKISESRLSEGVASVSGKFDFTNPNSVPDAGLSVQSVTFNPTDDKNYTTTSISVNVTVNKATSAITLGNLAITYDGNAKSVTATTNPSITGKVNIKYSGVSPTVYSETSTPPTQVGSYALAATISDNNYAGNTTGTLVISKATPTITTTPSASAITYGQKLSNSILSNGIASVPGKFEFTNTNTTPNTGVASQSVTFTPIDATNYNTATTSVTVTVNKTTPTITTKPSATVLTFNQTLAQSTLSGGSASVSGNFTFTNPSTKPAIGTTTQSVTFTPSDTTNYLPAETTINVTTKAGPEPVINQQPASIIALQGGSATFTIKATGQNLSYQWKRNGVDISNARGSSYSVSSTSIAMAGEYSVVLSSDNGSQPVTSRVAKLIVTFPLADLTINENTSPVLSVSVTGTGLKYQWFKDGMPLRGQTNSTLTLKDITADQAGTYSVEVTDANGNKFTSQTSKVTVKAVLPEIVSQPGNVSIYETGKATMRVTVKGSGHRYQWKKNGVNIPGETKNTLLLNDAILSDAGEYTVSITNSVGTVTSRAARLRILTSNSNPSGATARPTITSHPISQTVVDGVRLSLSVRASGGGLLYQWTKNRKNITGANQSSYTIPSASATDSGDYAVIVYNSLGTVTSNIARIAISAPEIDVQQPAGSSLVSSTSKISFGTAKTTSTGIRRTFTIRNTGTTKLTGISFSKRGSHQSDYTVTQSNLREVAPGSSATFTVTFKPAATGARTASIRIASNDRDENPFIINLAGQGAR